MKKTIQNIALITLFLVLWKCQVFKEPAAAVMSTTLSTPKIVVKEEAQLPDADFNLKVKDLEGNAVNMEDYRGKVIFLNFWATWCMPCVAELPSINKLYKQFKDEEIAFLLISNEAPEKVKSYHTKKGFDVPFVVQNKTSTIPPMYYSPGIPTTFIINKEGKIVKAGSGAEDWDDEEFVKILKQLL